MMRSRTKPASLLLSAGLIFAFANTLASADDDAQAREALWLTDHAKLVYLVKTLKVGDVDLKDATISETLDFLRRQSRISDPDHQGINIVIIRGRPELDSIKVNVQLKQATVGDVLQQIPEVRAEIGAVAVDLMPGWGDWLISRTFDVADNSLAIDPSMIIDQNKRIYDVKSLFETKGIRFGPGDRALYNLPKKKLTVVVSDPEDTVRIDELLVYGFKTIR